MPVTDPKWKRFEKLIHEIHTQWAPEGATIKLDDEIIGCQSKVPRQIDISIRVKVSHYDVLIVVECKDQARPIDVGELGSFVSLLEDVKANKGVMISTSGYTPAAIEMARARGIDTRTYVDTEGVDWRTEVAIPVLLVRVKLDWAASFSGVPGYRWAVPTNIPFPLIETFAEDGTPLGPIIVLLGKKWNNDETLHEPGDYRITLAEHALVNVGTTQAHIKIEVLLKVERCYYRGPVSVSFAGFRNEQDGSLLTKELTTDFIDPARIERGEMPEWSELTEIKNFAIDRIDESQGGGGGTSGIGDSAKSGTPIEAMLIMQYIDGLPEGPNDLYSYGRILRSASGHSPSETAVHVERWMGLGTPSVSEEA